MGLSLNASISSFFLLLYSDFDDNFLIKLGAYCFENLTQLEYL